MALEKICSMLLSNPVCVRMPFMLVILWTLYSPQILGTKLYEHGHLNIKLLDTLGGKDLPIAPLNKDL